MFYFLEPTSSISIRLSRTSLVLRRVMPREGTTYHVDDLWRGRVESRLRELERNQLWLATESGCPRSMISELLSGKRDVTTYLPEIHKALGWDPPMGPLLSKDDEELLRIVHRLDAEQRAALKERALVLDEQRRREAAAKKGRR